jgi:nitrite reductase/ring-hydroxylating ferredoxin subunit
VQHHLLKKENQTLQENKILVIEEWYPTLRKSEIQINKIYPAIAGSTKIILMNYDGSILAYRDACPHEGFPLSKHAEIIDEVIVCNKHLWEFECWSGEYIGRIKRPNCNLYSYETRDNSGVIEVLIPTD